MIDHILLYVIDHILLYVIDHILLYVIDHTNTNTNTFILEIYTYIHEIFWKYIHDMAMKRKFIMYAPGNRNYGYCRLHFGYQIMIYIYIYITSLIETSRLMLIKIK